MSDAPRSDDLTDEAVLRAVTEVFYDYAEAVDDGDPERFAELFTADCRFDGGEPAPGREWLARHAGRVLAQFTATSHHISQIRVRSWDGERAKVSAYVIAHHRMLDGNTFDALGRYRSTLVIDDGRWRFAEHDILFHDNIGTDGRTYLRIDRAALSRYR